MKEPFETILWLRGFIEKGIRDIIYIIIYVGQLSMLIKTGLRATLMKLILGTVCRSQKIGLGKSWVTLAVRKLSHKYLVCCCFEPELLMVQYNQNCSTATEVIATLITTKI